MKLWLVHRHEIGVCDYPFDDPWYVIASTRWYWWGSYAENGFIRPPAYPLWIALSRGGGLPLRLSTELLFLTAAGALSLALLRAGIARIAAALVFALIAFNPFSVLVNDYVMSDALYAPVLLLSVAGMVVLLARRGNRLAALWTGLTLAALWHTRYESPLVVVHVLLFVVVAAWVRARQGHRARTIARELTATGLLIATVVAGSTFVVRALNQRAFGVFADHQLAMPGFRELSAALFRIAPERQACSAPVTKEALDHAYNSSPALRSLQPYFDTPEGRQWESASMQIEAGQHEIAGGFFPWALQAAIRWAGHGDTAAEMETFCRRCAAELDAACSAGQMPCTSALVGAWVPLRNCLPRMPSSALAVGRLFFWTGPAFAARCPSMSIAAEVIDVFDAAANRRTALISDGLHIAGWAVDLADPVRAVSFRDTRGQIIAFTDQLRARSDLDAAFRERRGSLSEPLRAAFELEILLPHSHAPGGALIFTQRSGARAEVAYDALRTVPLKHRLVAGDGGSLEYAIEERDIAPDGLGFEDRALTSVLRSYGWVVVGLSLVGLAAMCVLVPARRRATFNPVLCGAGLLVLGLTAVRFALFTVVHALIWPGVDARYLYPVVYLLPCGLVVLIGCAAGTLQRRSNHASGSMAMSARTPAAKP